MEQLELRLAGCHKHNVEISAAIVLLPHSHLGGMEEARVLLSREAFKARILQKICGV